MLTLNQYLETLIKFLVMHKIDMGGAFLRSAIEGSRFFFLKKKSSNSSRLFLFYLYIANSCIIYLKRTEIWYI